MSLFGALPGGLAQLARPAAGANALLPQIVTVVAAAAIAAQLAVLAWRFVPSRRPPPPPVAAQQPPADLGELLHARLFGVAATDNVSGQNAPRTRVALVLAGTLAGPDPHKGLAIIGESAQAGRVYAVGAMLPGGVRLHEVYRDRVVLDRDGVLETLPLPHAVAAGGSFAELPGRSALPGSEPTLSASVQRLIAQGPEVIGDLLRPMPAYVGGQLKGFRVYPGRDRRKFTRLGLQPNDVVTQVNGVPLGDAQRGMEILRSLGSGPATVTIERGGAVQQLSIDAAEIGSLTEDLPPAAVPDNTPPTTSN